jgi:hypothetical protein
MRKLFWCGAVVAMMAATAVYLVAEDARRGPDSLFARGVGIACKVGGYNLAHLAGQIVGSYTSCGRPRADDPSGGEEDSEAWIPADPEPVAEACPDQAVPVEPGQPLEPIDVLQGTPETRPAGEKKPAPAGSPVAAVSVPTAPSDRAGEKQGVPADLLPASSEEGVVPVAIIPPDGDAREAQYRTMPPCTDEEAALPAIMPYAGDDEVAPAQGWLDFWLGVFRHVPCCRGVATGPNCPATKGRPEKPGSKAADQRLKQLLRSFGNDENHPRKPGIDTLEFRPSDAKQGEFDRTPY